MTETQPGAENRGENRTHRPESAAFKSFIMSQWGSRAAAQTEAGPAAPFTAARREAISALFPGERLVLPAGPLRTRSNDTDYRYRPPSAFAHLSGLGADREPGAALVLHPLPDGAGHEAVLYFQPLAGRDTEEFYASSRTGEFWVGPRPTLDEIAAETGIRTAPLDELAADLGKDVGGDPGAVLLRLVPGVDETIAAVVEEIRAASGTAEGAAAADSRLAEALSELRLVKDEFEIEQMRAAVAATIAGFERVVHELPRARGHRRGERVVEGTFDANARQEGNAVGYETIAASGEHATTLHWIRNDGAVRAGDLLLLDAGVEVESLYTADITRTLPVSGTFTEVQRRVYQAVLDAADAAFAVAKPGSRFRDVHDAAIKVIAARLA